MLLRTPIGRRTPIGAGMLLACNIAMAQTPDPRVDELTRETAQLKRTITAQERRIADLEKAVKGLQAIVGPVPARIPSETPLWQLAFNWNLIKKGMSEAQVVEILGPPANVQSVDDVRKLFYQPDSRSTLTLNGSVTLTDDRVTASLPPAFPQETPPWQLASNWSAIKIGMSEEQVVEFLGTPTRVQSVTDLRTLYYQSGSRATAALNGSVMLTDDRVTAVHPPKL
jgi:hypothetical protein